MTDTMSLVSFFDLLPYLVFVNGFFLTNFLLVFFWGYIWITKNFWGYIQKQVQLDFHRLENYDTIFVTQYVDKYFLGPS